MSSNKSYSPGSCQLLGNRFLHQRPSPLHMQAWSRASDTQRQWLGFIGARRELKEELAEMDQNQVKQEMLKESCDWFKLKLNVPTASHMGGIWERQIRTVRSVLCALLEKNGHQMNDEALRTFMCEAEAVVNSRHSRTTHS